jgi:hypothetical protein
VTRYVEPRPAPDPDLSLVVAPNPCASCPYRRDVPSGLWDPAEYAKLPAYDAATGDQPWYAFGCHRDDGRVCAGWLGHRRPQDLLAVRIGVISNVYPATIMNYRTDVPLFGTGAEACAHGVAKVDAPDPDAVAAAVKIIAARRARGVSERGD